MAATAALDVVPSGWTVVAGLLAAVVALAFAVRAHRNLAGASVVPTPLPTRACPDRPS